MILVPNKYMFTFRKHSNKNLTNKDLLTFSIFLSVIKIKIK